MVLASFCLLSYFNPLSSVKLECKIHYFLFKYLTMQFQPNGGDWGYIKRNTNLIPLSALYVLPVSLSCDAPALICLQHTQAGARAVPAELRAHIGVFHDSVRS